MKANFLPGVTQLIMFGSLFFYQSHACWADERKPKFVFAEPSGGMFGVFAEAMEFSNDGKLLVSSNTSGSVKMHDMVTGKQTRRITVGEYLEPIQNFALSADGKRLVTYSADLLRESESAKVWDMETEKKIATLVVKARRLMISPDGKMLATAEFSFLKSDEKPAVRIWDMKNFKELCTLRKDVLGYLFALFSPDSQIVAIGSVAPGNKEDFLQTVHLWDFRAKKEIKLVSSETGVAFLTAGFSPDSKTLAVGDALLVSPTEVQGVVRFFDVATGKERDVIKIGSSSVDHVAFSSDGKSFAVAGTVTEKKGIPESSEISLWDSATLKRLASMRVPAFQGRAAFEPLNIAFNSDLTMVAFKRTNYEIEVWDLPELAKLKK